MAWESTVRILRDAVGAPKFQQLHARVAKRALAQHLAQAADKPEVVRYVDGRQGDPEESVKLYGVIRYEFIRLAAIARAGLDLARQLSPMESGKYRESWFLMVDGVQVDRVPPGAREIVLTNDQPYHRKLEMTVNSEGQAASAHAAAEQSMGAYVAKRYAKFNRPPGIVEKVRQQLGRKFGDSFDAQITFIELEGGYVLKGKGRSRFYRKDIPSRGIRAGMRRPMPKATASGAAMTYPALILRPL